MKRFIPLFFLLLAPTAKADITHEITSSIKLQVDAAASAAQRIGSSYSASGTNITVDTAGGLGTLSAGDAVGYTPIADNWSVTTAGDSWIFSEAFTEGDATPSAVTIDGTAGTATLSQFGIVTTSAGGVAGSLDGSIASDHALDLTAGNAGTSATGQVITSIQIK